MVNGTFYTLVGSATTYITAHSFVNIGIGWIFVGVE
jgi:hypothetical protein